MIICPRCKTENVDGAEHCKECNMTLIASGTHQLDAESLKLLPLRSVGDTRFMDRMHLRIKIGKSELDTIVVDQFTIGRLDPQNGVGKPDLDLTPYDVNHYVSRSHAMLTRDHGALFIRDVGSTNGTWVNGVRLRMGVPQVLAEGDEIYLGETRLELFFKL